MQSLLQVARSGRPAGVPIPTPGPFRPLEAAEIRFRRGQVVMIAAQPNGGKTLASLAFAVAANVPTLYVSADTDDRTMLTRSAAIVSQQTVAEIEELLDHGGREMVEDDIDTLSNLRFSFDPSPSMEDIDLEVQAFEEAFGEPPHLLVVDNLLNVSGGGDEWGGLRSTMSDLHSLARASEACIIVLHHISESNNRDPRFPASRFHLMGKIAALPEMILTVGMDSQEGLFRVAAVKNRSGPHDPTGETYTTLYVDAARMTIHPNVAELAAARKRSEWT